MPESNAQTLIGREELLGSTGKALKLNVENGINPQFVYVQGGPGLGKTSFVESLAGNLSNFLEADFVNIRLNASREVFSSEKLKQRIFHSVRSDNSWLQERISTFRRAAEKDTKQEKGGPVLKELHEHIQTQAEAEGIRLPGWVIILDDYEKFSMNERTALQTELLQPLTHCNFSGAVCLLLVTSDLSLVEAKSNFRELFGTFRCNLDLELHPFSEEDLIQFLEKIELPPDLYDVLWEKSNGNWQKLHQEIQGNHIPKNPNYWDRIAINIIYKYNDIPKKWIFLAGLLLDYEIDIVEIFYEKKVARQAVRWISDKFRHFLNNLSKPRSLKGEMAFALRRLYAKMDPDNYRIDIYKAEALNELIEEVPDLEHRQVLTRLALFNYFNKQVLQEVIPENGTELIRFVEKNSAYFLNTNENIKIRPNLLRKLKEFRQIKRISESPEETQRLNRLWRSKKDQYESELKGTREFLAEREISLKEINKNLSQLRKQMTNSKKKIRKKSANRTSRTHGRRKYSIGITDILLQLSGIILIYLCIIFSNYLSVAYIPLGILLIVVGFLQPRFNGRALSPVGQSGLAISVPENDSSNHLMELKMENLKNQKSMITVKITKIKKEVKRLQSLVDESYVT